MFSPRCLRRAFSNLSRSSISNVDAKLSNSSRKPWCLVYGGGGSLGQSVIEAFNKNGFFTINADFNLNSSASINLITDKNLGFRANVEKFRQQIQEIQKNEEE